ncbi:MAG: TetR family transcriptional regulator [Solirubrobacteraceae bacterium]|jgi:AcrR family transcriptional regulator
MPRGRRAGPPRTRQAIIDSARAAFAEHGYDAVSLRSIARAAGVDPALVHHFFESKSALFAAAMSLPVDPEPFVAALLAGAPNTIGERLVLALVELWDRPDGFHGFLGLVRGAVSHADAARMLREFVTREILGRLATAAAPDNPQARAALAGTQIIGLAMGRKIVGIAPLAEADPAWLATTIGPTIQHYLTAPLPQGGPRDRAATAAPTAPPARSSA